MDKNLDVQTKWKGAVSAAILSEVKELMNSFARIEPNNSDIQRAYHLIDGGESARSTSVEVVLPTIMSMLPTLEAHSSRLRSDFYLTVKAYTDAYGAFTQLLAATEKNSREIIKALDRFESNLKMPPNLKHSTKEIKKWVKEEAVNLFNQGEVTSD
jgi:hypothetical protein